jgi:hypothetical protein
VRPFTVVPPAPDTQSVQLAAEGVVTDKDDGRIEFLGERFGLAERIGLMPMLAFANASKRGLDSDDLEGMAAMYALIRDVLDQRRTQAVDPATGEPAVDAAGEPVWEGPSEWMRFEAHAIDQQADGEELMKFVGEAMALVAARPRKRREVSSAGSPQTSPTSKDISSSPVIPAQAHGLVPVAQVGR